MKGFDPSKLAPPQVVNPKIIASTEWEVRVNTETFKVNVQGLIEKWDLETNGVMFAPFQDADKANHVLLWPVPKEEAMSIKGTGAENKMIALVQLLKKANLISSDEQIVYFKVEPIEGHADYYALVRDALNESVLYPEKSDDTSDTDAPEAEEHTDKEIEDSVEAES